jgi:hypothetical protein
MDGWMMISGGAGENVRTEWNSFVIVIMYLSAAFVSKLT